MGPSWQPPAELARRAMPIAIVLIIAALAYWWSSAPSATSAALAPEPRSEGVHLVIDVEGAVRHPGVYRMQPGARVIDAIDAAGGLESGAIAGVNMARTLVDGELVMLGEDRTGASVADGRIDVNRATVAELDGLPGIGAVLAQRIIDHRTAHGPFRRARDLLQVPGIGEAKYRDLEGAVTVG